MSLTIASEFMVSVTNTCQRLSLRAVDKDTYGLHDFVDSFRRRNLLEPIYFLRPIDHADRRSCTRHSR